MKKTKKERASSRLFRKLVRNGAFRKKYLRGWLEDLPEEMKGRKEGKEDGRQDRENQNSQSGPLHNGGGSRSGSDTAGAHDAEPRLGVSVS